MKRRIDIEKAAEAESFGVLAVGANRKHRGTGVAGRRFTSAQNRALSDLARSLVKVVREAGAEKRRITVRGVSFELRQDGIEEILSIRTSTGS
jgi:hypothetical protein